MVLHFWPVCDFLPFANNLNFLPRSSTVDWIRFSLFRNGKSNFQSLFPSCPNFAKYDERRWRRRKPFPNKSSFLSPNFEFFKGGKSTIIRMTKDKVGRHSDFAMAIDPTAYYLFKMIRVVKSRSRKDKFSPVRKQDVFPTLSFAFSWPFVFSLQKISRILECQRARSKYVGKLRNLCFHDLTFKKNQIWHSIKIAHARLGQIQGVPNDSKCVQQIISFSHFIRNCFKAFWHS